MPLPRTLLIIDPLAKQRAQLSYGLTKRGFHCEPAQALADYGTRLPEDAVILANPVGVAAMFTTGLFGIFATIDDIARSAGSLGDPGSIAGSISRYERQLQRNDAQLATIAEQQERLRERMTKTFIAAETNISASQSTLGFLRQQIDIWNAQSSR